MKAIGPTFSAELESAGLLGLPFSWGSDGVVYFGDGMTQEQRNAVEAVYEAHDPEDEVQIPVPTKQELLAQAQALMVQVENLAE